MNPILFGLHSQNASCKYHFVLLMGLKKFQDELCSTLTLFFDILKLEDYANRILMNNEIFIESIIKLTQFELLGKLYIL